MRLRALVDQLSAMLAYWDSGERCRFANRAYQQWFGVAPELMVGRTLRDLWGSLYERERPYVEGVLGGAPQEFEQLIPDPRGGPDRHCLAQYLPDMVSGRARGFFALVTDVSSLKRAQLSLLEMDRKLQASERLVSLGTLAAGIAHEINSPLTSVSVNVQLALEQLESGELEPSLMKSDLLEAKSATDRIEDIVKSMRLLARGGPSTVERVDVNRTLEHSITLTSTTVRFRAQVERQFSDVAQVTADASQLAQVFVNLLTNAAQALEGRAPGLIRLRTFRREDSTVVEVSDNGCGIPADVQGRIFDPFFTTKQAGAGLGLGLSISAAIVKGIGGEISFASRPEQGSVFQVVLPAGAREEGRALRPASAAVRTEPRSGTRHRVLVIDDDVAVSAVLRRILVRHADVVVQNDARQALELLRTRGREFSLILCDLMMPSLNGNELYGAVSSVDPQLAERFVFMTGGAFTDEGRRFLSGVSLPVIEKPFDVSRIRELLADKPSG